MSQTKPIPRLLCLTPTRNEAWIIDHFLRASRLWADDVIIADQRSTDGTPEHVLAAGAHLVRNDSPTFDESHRQRLLLNRAREIPGNRILIGLDADEALSANVTTSRQWQLLRDAQPGTILRFRWVNVLPGFKSAWIQPTYIPFGFIDDGAKHVGKRIHSPRVPQPAGAPFLDIDDVVVLHFQYVLWDRMRSKQRWYQTWEHIKNREKRPLQIFREYNHMHGGWPKSEIHDLRPEWLEGYDRAGVHFRSLRCEPVTWWDREVLHLIKEHGADELSRLAIWEKDWTSVARDLGVDPGNTSDPRSWIERAVHRLLYFTQGRRSNFGTRVLEHVLRRAGW